MLQRWYNTVCDCSKRGTIWNSNLLHRGQQLMLKMLTSDLWVPPAQNRTT